MVRHVVDVDGLVLAGGEVISGEVVVTGIVIVGGLKSSKLLPNTSIINDSTTGPPLLVNALCE